MTHTVRSQGGRRARPRGPRGGERAPTFSHAEIREFHRVSCGSPFSVLNDAQRLFLLQITTGLKRSGVVDGLHRKDKALIGALRGLASRCGLTSAVLDAGRLFKVFVSREPRDARELARLYEVPCEESGTTSLARERALVRRRGELLGYPSCCVARFLLNPGLTFFERFARLLGGLGDKPGFVSFNPLLNFLSGAPLIFHIPCSKDCKASLHSAHAALGLYYLYDASVAQKLLSLLRSPVIIFQDDYWCRMSGIFSRDVLRYVYLGMVDSNTVEGKRGARDRRYILETFRALRRGDRLVFLGDRFRVLKGGRQLRAHAFRAWPYAMFVPDPPGPRNRPVPR